ncbi:MAG: biopolymer transporter ExbD [Terriglobales bacterium]|jgi:biopolymer transport protein ExbD
MNSLLEVCLVVTLAVGITPSALAQSGSGVTPAMQKGIHVELPATSYAVSLPDADEQDAPIVTITEDGSVYFGVNRVNPGALEETVKGVLSNRLEKKLYIKADARTAYANVVRVIDAVRASGVETLGLLTTQPESPQPGTVMPPKGMQLSLAGNCSKAESARRPQSPRVLLKADN